MKSVRRVLLVIVLLFVSMVTVNANLESITEPGEYAVKLTYRTPDNQTITKTIKLTITQEEIEKKTPNEIIGEVIGVENKIINVDATLLPETGTLEVINARDIVVQKGVINKLSDTELIQRAEATAFDNTTNQEIPIVMVFKEKVNDQKYNITFATQKETTKTIAAYETTKVETIGWDDEKTKEVSSFMEINSKSITIGVLIMLIVPMAFVMLLYLFTNKKILDAEKILYKEKNKK